MRTGAQSAQLSVIAKSSLRHRLGCPLSKNNQDSSRTDESVHGSFPRRFLLVKSVRRVIVCSSFYFLSRWLLRLKNHHFAILKRPISVIIAGIGQRTRNANFALPVDNRYTGKLTAWSPCQELPAANEARIIVPQSSLEACSAGTEGGYRNWAVKSYPCIFAVSKPSGERITKPTTR